MSGYILCKTPMASVPYYIKNVGTNIYSIEELCYYLYQNLYLVDESLMNVGLCKWIGRELRMKELARRLSILMEHNTVPLEDFACEIPCVPSITCPRRRCVRIGTRSVRWRNSRSPCGKN